MDEIHFGRRYLKPYAEPVSLSELKAGDVYFSVLYYDDEMRFPVVETLVFIGQNLEPEDNSRVYFEDLESYFAGVRYDTSTQEDGAVFYAQEEKYLNHIFEYENALTNSLDVPFVGRNRVASILILSFLLSANGYRCLIFSSQPKQSPAPSKIPQYAPTTPLPRPSPSPTH
jgi:hypothetical protein